MKHFFFILFCLFAMTALSQETDNKNHLAYSSEIGNICKWNSNKQAAIVLTFDDWTPGQFPLVVPALKHHKMVATFFPIPNNIINSELGWKAVQTTIKNGNELGNHSLSHPDLTKLSDENLQQEIQEPKNLIETNTQGNKVVSFAYPYGAGADNARVIDSLKASGHIGARSVWGEWNYSYNFAKNDNDYYRIQIFGMNEQTKNSQFYEQVEKVIDGGGLLTFLYHSVDDDLNSYHDTWYAQVKLDSLKAQLDFLKAHENDVWVTTFKQAILYHREANNATLKRLPSSQNETHILLQTTNNFPSFIPQTELIPLTLQVKKDKTVVSISQNNKEIPIDKQTDDYVQFKALPNTEIILKMIE